MGWHTYNRHLVGLGRYDLKDVRSATRLSETSYQASSAGFEPATSSLEGSCSIQLSYEEW